MRLLKGLALLFGLALLIWVIRKIGVEEILQGFRTLGWRLVVPILILFVCYLLYTYSWQFFLSRFEHHSIPFWDLFRIKVAGEASSAVTPINFAGGDPIRVWLLSKSFPVEISGASVVVDRTLQILAIISIIFLGNVAAIFKLELPLYAKKLLAITAGLLLFFIVLFLFYQTRGFFQKVLRLLSRLRLRHFSEKTHKRFEEIDRHIGDFYRRDPHLFFICFLLLFLSRLVGTLEILFLARFLGVPMDLWGAIFFAAVIPVTNMLSVIVPGALGLLEGVMSSLFYALHWDPSAGVVLQIARRMRSLFWIIIGFLFILFFKTSSQRKARSQQSKI